jgi:hypothetical protein
MTRTLLVLAVAVALLGVSTTVVAEEREFVTRGEVLAVSAQDGTLKIREIAEPAENAPPGTMQDGVVRPFSVNADTEVTAAQGQSIELGQIQAGAHVVIHFILDNGKNVAKRIEVSSAATE